MRYLLVLLLLFAHPAEAARFRLDHSARAGIFLKNGAIEHEYRFRTDLLWDHTFANGTKIGTAVRFNWEPETPPTLSSPYFWVSWGKSKLTFNNTSGAVAAYVGIWGCAAGYRGASCADMVANLSPGGWAPVMTVSSSTGDGPGLVRYDTKLGKVQLSISGGGGNDTELAAAFAAGPAKVGLGWDSGPGTTGGITLVTDWKKGNTTFGLDAGFYGGVTNVVASVQIKKGENTYYAYASQLGGTNSFGVSYKRKLNKVATLGTAIEVIGGSLQADLGVTMRF